ncbi:uncharacterized protein BDZ99DRAFT_112953 [Mytilinidion resinicola]|uniref:Protein kinase domain-containing protein n=1 Tax=Mytilinidion resinicola TaxID=574789 RepID=A0A6A6Y8Y8_9PEZI|nr:uncharacterized protein BDZ99DRAFT_112953 [Mytilinidion resinicola]KAF2805099.1 hypothetical protein BDZ99DRAFT_112953 [Mytilinidion resinicola]
MEYNLKEACSLGLVSTDTSITTTIKSMMHALLEMRRKNCAHHDVKPENIGVRIENGEIIGAKLMDLGSCYRYAVTLSPFIKMLDLLYTAPYRPPETWNLGITSTASDIFALGVTVSSHPLLLHAFFLFSLALATQSRELWQHGMLHEEAPYRTETQIKETQWVQQGLKGTGFYKNTTSYDGIAGEL